jgi:hypothetical protein
MGGTIHSENKIPRTTQDAFFMFADFAYVIEIGPPVFSTQVRLAGSHKRDAVNTGFNVSEQTPVALRKNLAFFLATVMHQKVCNLFSYARTRALQE